VCIKVLGWKKGWLRGGRGIDGACGEKKKITGVVWLEPHRGFAGVFRERKW